MCLGDSHNHFDHILGVPIWSC